MSESAVDPALIINYCIRNRPADTWTSSLLVSKAAEPSGGDLLVRFILLPLDTARCDYSAVCIYAAVRASGLGNVRIRIGSRARAITNL